MITTASLLLALMFKQTLTPTPAIPIKLGLWTASICVQVPSLRMARFLHRLVGYPDQDHNPNIDGTRPGGLGFLDDARPSITWPDERLNHYDWRVDEILELDTVQSALVIQIGKREFIS